MAFFEKISEKGQNAKKKTRDFVEVQKINSMISNEENNINNNYFQIGKLYVSMHSGDCEEEFKGMVEAVHYSEKKINTYKEQIQSIKGIVRCEGCGAEVSIHSAFCNACGAPMPKRAPEKKIDENMVRCPACGNAVKKGLRFCTNCGNPMQEMNRPQEMTQPQEMNRPQEMSQPQEMNQPQKNIIIKVCPQCGEETTEPDSMFCNNCGVKLIEKGSAPFLVEKKCPNCGFITTDDEMAFCTECGSKLN